MLVDNQNDTCRLWLNDTPGATATPADQLSTAGGDDTFGFRMGGNSSLKNFYIKTGGGNSSLNSGPLYLDDIYIESTDGAVNFSNPIPEPGTGLLLAASLMLIRRRRPLRRN